MTTNYTPSQFTGNPTTTQLNAELRRIRDALDNTLQRVNATADGLSQINQMELDLDLNGNQILNVGSNPDDPNSLVTRADLADIAGFDASDLMNDISLIQFELGVLQAGINANESALSNTTGDITDLQTANASLTQSLATLNNTLTGLNQQITLNQQTSNSNANNVGQLLTDVTNLQTQLAALETALEGMVQNLSSRDITQDTTVLAVTIPVTVSGFQHIFTAAQSQAAVQIAQLRVNDYINVRWDEPVGVVDGWTQEPQINVTIDGDTLEYGLRGQDNGFLDISEFYYGESARFQIQTLATPGVRGVLRMVSNSRVAESTFEKNYAFYGAGVIPDNTLIAGHPLQQGGFLTTVRAYARVAPTAGATIEILSDDVVIGSVVVTTTGIGVTDIDPSVLVQPNEWIELRAVTMNGMEDFGVSLEFNNLSRGS